MMECHGSQCSSLLARVLSTRMIPEGCLLPICEFSTDSPHGRRMAHRMPLVGLLLVGLSFLETLEARVQFLSFYRGAPTSRLVRWSSWSAKL